MADTLQVGAWYWLAGRGPMRLKEAADPPRKTTLTFTQPGTGFDYYAGPAEVTGPVKADTLRAYIAQHEAHVAHLVGPVSEELLALLASLLVAEAYRTTAAFNAQETPVPIADVARAWRRAEAAWNKAQLATVARPPAGVTRCASGSSTRNKWCPQAAIVEVRKPRPILLGEPEGSSGHVWMPLCANHDDHLVHGQQVRPVSSGIIPPTAEVFPDGL